MLFLDADDVLLPNAFEEQVRALAAHPDAALVYGRSVRWYGWTGAPADAARDAVSDLCVELDAMHEPGRLVQVWLRNENAAPANCSTMIRRAILESVEGFDEAFGDAYEDLVLLTKIALDRPVFVASPCWSRYRQHPAMSSAQRERAGEWHAARLNPIRLKYLEWLESYLMTARPEDEKMLNAVRSQLAPYRHPVAHRVTASRRRLGSAATLALSKLARRSRGRSTGSITAQPNPILLATPTGQGRTTLSWRAMRTDAVEVHVGAPDGPLFSRSESSGSATTDDWVFDGMTFYLQDAAGDSPRDPANTLDAVTVRVVTGDKPQPPPPRRLASTAPFGHGRREGDVPVGHVRFGDLARHTPISRDWGFDRGRPVSRYYVEQFLAEHAATVRGAVLEFGDAAYTRRFGGSAVTRSDVMNVNAGSPETTIVGDLADAPHIPSSTFDCVICTQTLQLIYDIDAAIGTLHRILKPGGVLLASVPGVGPTCGSWRDSTYWKFTPLAARRLFADVFGAANVDVAGHGNTLIAVAFLHGLVTDDVTQADLDHDEPGYEISITIRAVKSPPDNA